MAKFISDAEMQQLEQAGHAKDAHADFISDDDMAKLEDAGHATTPVAESGVRNFLQGVTLGFSDEGVGLGEAAGRALGIEGLSGPISDIHLAEGGPTLDKQKLIDAYKAGRDHERAALKQDMKDNPGTSIAANVVGGVVSPINKLKMLQGANLANQGAVTGAIYGAGASEKDNALGVATDSALSGLGGAAVGKGFELAGKALGKGVEATKGAVSKTSQRFSGTQAQEAEAAAEGASKAAATIEGGALEAEGGGKLFDYKAPKSLDELRKWQPKADSGALPGRARLAQIEKIVPDLETKPLKYHFDMMENPKSMKALKLEFENLPTQDAQKIAAYNQEIVKESESKIADTIKQLAGGKDARTLTDAGDDFIGAVKSKYNEEKKALSPLFQKLRQQGDALNPEEAQGLIAGLAQDSKLGALLRQDEKTGRFILGPNKTRSGISDAEHGVLARLIDDLNDGMSFSEIQKAREFLRKAIDPANPGATEEIGKVRSILLKQLEDLAGGRGPDVGQTFKAYAQNERARESIEKIIGGKIESLDQMFAANPDRVVKKVFSNPNYAKIVGAYVGPEKMDELAASYIQQGLAKATDPAKGFAPHTFKNWLKSNEQFLAANVSPETRERLSALADYGWYGRRFLDEVNPSGTAASLQAMIQPKDFAMKVKQDGIYGAIAAEATGRVSAKLKQQQAIEAVNRAMGASEESAKRFSLPKFATENAGIDRALTRGTTAASAQQAAPLLQAVAQKDKKAAEPTPAMRPLKGKEKWAQDGLQKAIEAAPQIEKQKGALLENPKAKSLLIALSDLKPGTKAFQNTMAQLKALSGSKA